MLPFLGKSGGMSPMVFAASSENRSRAFPDKQRDSRIHRDLAIYRDAQNASISSIGLSQF